MGRKSRYALIHDNLDICISKLLNDKTVHKETFYLKHDDLWVEMTVLHRDKRTGRPIRINLTIQNKEISGDTKDFLDGITVGCLVGRDTLVELYTEYVLKRIQIIVEDRRRLRKAG